MRDLQTQPIVNCLLHMVKNVGPTSSAKSHERYVAEYGFNGWEEVFLDSVHRPWRMRRRPKLKFLDKNQVKKANKYPTKRSKTAFSIKEMNKKRVKNPFFSRFFASISDPSPSSLASLVLSSKPKCLMGSIKSGLRSSWVSH